MKSTGSPGELLLDVCPAEVGLAGCVAIEWDTRLPLEVLTLID